MKESDIKQILDSLQKGTISTDEASQIILKGVSSIDKLAELDTSRESRTGVPEVIYGEGKSATQVSSIIKKFDELGHNTIVTRLSPSKADHVLDTQEGCTYHENSQILYKIHKPAEKLEGTAAVLCAGTSDLQVAEEASVLLELLGGTVYRKYDVGVAGIHRFFNALSDVRSAKVVIVVAGMDGALPSVVGGQVKAPVIAVPTSVGYGASFKGIAPLLTMLNSCAPGVSVVNIDNGFGAAVCALKILKGIG